MGEVRKEITIIGTRGRVTVKGVVDTGATDLNITPKIADAVGISSPGIGWRKLGNGALIEVKTGMVREAMLQGRSTRESLGSKTWVPVTIMGDEVLIGVHLLEWLGFGVDPTSHTLEDRGALLRARVTPARNPAKIHVSRTLGEAALWGVGFGAGYMALEAGRKAVMKNPSSGRKPGWRRVDLGHGTIVHIYSIGDENFGDVARGTTPGTWVGTAPWAGQEAFRTIKEAKRFVEDGYRVVRERETKLKHKTRPGPPRIVKRWNPTASTVETAKEMRKLVKQVIPSISVRMGSGTARSWIEISGSGHDGNFTEKERALVSTLFGGASPGMNFFVISPDDKDKMLQRLRTTVPKLTRRGQNPIHSCPSCRKPIAGNPEPGDYTCGGCKASVRVK